MKLTQSLLLLSLLAVPCFVGCRAQEQNEHILALPENYAETHPVVLSPVLRQSRSSSAEDIDFTRSLRR